MVAYGYDFSQGVYGAGAAEIPLFSGLFRLNVYMWWDAKTGPR